jgi:hypothetical protein
MRQPSADPRIRPLPKQEIGNAADQRGHPYVPGNQHPVLVRPFSHAAVTQQRVPGFRDLDQAGTRSPRLCGWKSAQSRDLSDLATSMGTWRGCLRTPHCLYLLRFCWRREHDHHASRPATRTHEAALQAGEREVWPACPNERVQVQFLSVDARPRVRAVIDHAAGTTCSDAPAIGEGVSECRNFHKNR